METIKKVRKTKTEQTVSENTVETAYVDYLLNQGHRPASVFKFSQDIGITEERFYDYFGSFEGLEKKIWKGFIDRTISRLQNEETFIAFSAREKILTFYYSFFEELKSNRSFVLMQLEHHRKLEITPGFLKDFREAFESFIETILNGGKTRGEIANRPYLDKRYPRIFWMHMGFLLIFWKEDNSAGFEKTDVAIEKSVNLAFDLIGKGAVDSVIDFAKFLYQTKVK